MDPVVLLLIEGLGLFRWLRQQHSSVAIFEALCWATCWYHQRAGVPQSNDRPTTRGHHQNLMQITVIVLLPLRGASILFRRRKSSFWFTVTVLMASFRPIKGSSMALSSTSLAFALPKLTNWSLCMLRTYTYTRMPTIAMLILLH